MQRLVGHGSLHSSNIQLNALDWGDPGFSSCFEVLTELATFQRRRNAAVVGAMDGIAVGTRELVEMLEGEEEGDAVWPGASASIGSGESAADRGACNDPPGLVSSMFLVGEVPGNDGSWK